MKPARRQLLRLMAAVAVLPAAQRIAKAQTYPTRPITIIVPFAPGGGTDVSARVVGEHMSRTLGQQFVIENFPGAGGTTGSIRAMRAIPDGYTIEMGHIGTTPSRSGSTPSSPTSRMSISNRSVWLWRPRS
jgi:tripartite-type tricarboxylate transporter receptor subunit TctC